MGADRGLSIEEILSNKKLDDIEDKIDTIDGIVDAVLVDTGTTLEARLDGNRVFGIFNTGVPPIGEPLGDAYFVDGDVTASGAGTTWATAVKTIDEAPALCTDMNGDCIFVQPKDSSATYNENANASGVTIDLEQVHLFGTGSRSVLVENSHAGATAVFTISAHHVEIAGFYIGESTNTVEGIYSTGDYEGLWIHDNQLSGTMENGIHLDGPDRSIIEDNRIFNCTNDGIELSSVCGYVVVRRNIISGVGDNGIHLNGNDVDSNWVLDNDINGDGGTTDTGINIVLGDSNTIVGNSVGGCVAAGSDTGTNNVKRDNHGEFGTIASYPVGAGPITCTGGAVAWAYGAWVQVVAAAGLANDFDIIGIQFLVDTATQYEVAIGIGGAGVEVKIIHVPTDTQAVNTEYAFTFDEPRKVRAGTRFAVACATLAGVGVETADCKVIVRVDPW